MHFLMHLWWCGEKSAGDESDQSADGDAPRESDGRDEMEMTEKLKRNDSDKARSHGNHVA